MMNEPPLAFGDVIIVGGGCYGTFYTEQLLKARDRDKARFVRLLVVDRDPACRIRRVTQDCEVVVEEWDRFFDRYLARAAADPTSVPAGSVIVPSPLMPHLMFNWLLRRARSRWPDRAVAVTDVGERVGTPYETTAPDHTRYVSYADWLCPTHCIEPAICPVIKASRSWEMSEAVAALVDRLRPHANVAGPVTFLCRHRVFGVGTFSVDDVLAGDRLVAEAGAPGAPVEIVVGTISACHGALNRLRIGGATSLAETGNH